MAQNRTPAEYQKEAFGWLAIAAFIVIFPTLFFVCAFFPIWMGWASRW